MMLRRVMVSKYVTRPMRSEDTDAARGISGRSISAWEEVGEAVFHGFGVDYEESDAGFGNYSTAIVEWPTGQVEMVRADKIRFIENAPIGEFLGADKLVPVVGDIVARSVALSGIRHGTVVSVEFGKYAKVARVSGLVGTTVDSVPWHMLKYVQLVSRFGKIIDKKYQP